MGNIKTRRRTRLPRLGLAIMNSWGKSVMAVWAAIGAAACLVAPAVASADPIDYFIGNGVNHKARISFRVVDDQVKSGLLRTKAPIKTSHGDETLTAIDNFTNAALQSSGAFHVSYQLGRSEIQTRVVLAGRVHGLTAVGRARAMGSLPDLEYDSGKIHWQADAVSRSDYLDFGGRIGSHLAGNGKAAVKSAAR